MNVTVGGHTQPFRTVAFDAGNNSVRLIEQRLLPHEFKIVTTKNFRETARAITDMVVRGAGAIGATGAIQLFELVTQLRGEAGERQVENARIGFAENGGGFHGLEEAACVCTILEAPVI